jgi:hypothetical protein
MWEVLGDFGGLCNAQNLSYKYKYLYLRRNELFDLEKVVFRQIRQILA